MHTDPGTTQPSPIQSGALGGARRSIAMALLAIALLVVGGSAVAMAADPSTAPTPAETTQPAEDATTPPAADGTTGSGRRAHGDCPDKDGSAGTGPGTDGSGTTPVPTTAPDVTTPAPSIDTPDV